MNRLLVFVCAFFLSQSLWAFDEQNLAQQLAKIEVLRGEFVQEKFLRGLDAPLTSKGNFVLAKQQGLLWNLQAPLVRSYRITATGIALRVADQWQLQTKQDAANRQSRLFLAVLAGDQQGLEEDFSFALSGDEHGWQLVLTPKALLLQQIFTQIVIKGADYVHSIELHETQGDRTLMRMENVEQYRMLKADEKQAFSA